MSNARYLAPNLVTFAALLLGVTSIVLAVRGDYVNAAWMILWATVADRLDGLVARALKATSEFGVQMDSFGDFVNFGLAPAFLLYFALSRCPTLPFQDGGGLIALYAACVAWLLGATFRLARFNVLIEETPDHRIFFGIPTTLAAAMLCSWFLVILKYASPDNPLRPPPGSFTEWRLFGELSVGPGVWPWFLAAMVLFAGLMVSNVRMRKFGALGGKLLTGILYVFALSNIAVVAARILPDYIVLFATSWTLLFTVLGFIDPRMRGDGAPPLFPVGRANDR
ncbi:MAG: CDP-alcohol phosphatidyltransferase family protein [Nannocystaceae bacterium]|nr:CDP-alcohol phosphatidyltransferase family protein [Myxococcales bacterium]